MRLLILGGTTEASGLVRRIAGRADLQPVLSFAGRTQSPVPPPIPFRVGGFGGVGGLEEYLSEHRVEAVIDATHPFAAQMSRHAAAACGRLGVPLAVFTRPAWRRRDGDRWTSVGAMAEAAKALGRQPRRVFLTIGGLQLAAFAEAPQHYYIVRTIDPPDAVRLLPSHRLILARGPFTIDDEIALMRDEKVDALVTKNSGGSATEAKLAAARAVGVEVIIVERPVAGAVAVYETLDGILAWIEAHRGTP
nr:cobalt-precorrin-6A reductase [uncultured Rhodopila sp.]